MSNVTGHTAAIQDEFERAQSLHPHVHSIHVTAEIILMHALELHQLAFTPGTRDSRDEENKLLTQIGALTLRRLDDSNAEPWKHCSDPSQGA